MSARPTGAALSEARPVPEPHPGPEPHPVPEAHPVVVPHPRRAPVDARAPVVFLDGVDRGWAVAEIRPDGTLGPWTALPGPATAEAAGPDRAAASAPATMDPLLELRLGQLEAARGRHGEAVRCMTRALRVATPMLRQRCLAELALVEAYASRLQRSAAFDALAEEELPGATSDVLDLARAWRDLAQGDLTDARRRLDRVEQASNLSTNPWHGTVQVLASAELSLATGRPEAALRVLGEAPPLQDQAIDGWREGVLTAARADALLATGEGRRALALITPLPSAARAEAGVVAAAARAAVSDVRGAMAVLGAVRDDVDTAPVTIQVRAWLLEARLEHQRGNRADRSRLLVNRALQEAAAEGLTTPLRRELGWLRAVIESDNALQHAYRRLLDELDPRRQGGTWPRVAVPAVDGSVADADDTAAVNVKLTQREQQVLNLLAAMYSTEEIAAELFVTGNTIKTHLKGIFGKLGVNRRVEAVRRGRQLGLC